MLKNWNLQLKIGVPVLLAFLIIGFVFPLFMEGTPLDWGTYPKNRGPSTAHLLGTTSLGQDTFWMLVMSIRNSFVIGLLVALFATLIGVLVGLFSGFRGGLIDRAITLIIDTFIVIPQLPILILMGSLLKGRTSVLAISTILVLINWPWPGRQARAMAMSLRERDFIDTARFSGQGTFSIIIREIFPFVSGWSLANFVNTILVAIQAESSLAVIGLSNNSEATLGTMIYWANQYQAMLAGNWWWIGSPVAAITLIFVSLFLTLSGAQQRNAYRRGKSL